MCWEQDWGWREPKEFHGQPLLLFLSQVVPGGLEIGSKVRTGRCSNSAADLSAPTLTPSLFSLPFSAFLPRLQLPFPNTLSTFEFPFTFLPLYYQIVKDLHRSGDPAFPQCKFAGDAFINWFVCSSIRIPGKMPDILKDKYIKDNYLVPCRTDHRFDSVWTAVREKSLLWSQEVTGAGSGKREASNHGPDAAESGVCLALGHLGGWACPTSLSPCPPLALSWALPPWGRPQALQHTSACLSCMAPAWSCYSPAPDIFWAVVLLASCLSDCTSDAVSHVWPISKQHHRMKFKQCRCSDTGLYCLDHEGKVEVRSESLSGLPQPGWLASPCAALCCSGVCVILCFACFSLPLPVTRTFLSIHCPSSFPCMFYPLSFLSHRAVMNVPGLLWGQRSLTNSTLFRP